MARVFNIFSPGIEERKLVGNNAASQLTPDERKKFMTNNAHQKIDGWFKEEIVLLKAKGATPADIPEEAFEELLADNVCKRHLDEIKADPELINEVRDAVLKYASPEELREFASKLRVAGNAEAAYDLEELADQREGR